MASPYADLEPRSFWSTGVRHQGEALVDDLYRKRFEIGPDDRIATAGSCFAQRVTRQLRDRGFTVLDTEPAPPGLPPEVARRFGYSLFSARYGNLYVARQLLQLWKEAHGLWEPSDWIWTEAGRFYDAMRPGVEPDGLDSADEVRAHRAHHLRRVRELFAQTDVFIFTLGLTEAWRHRASGTVYTTAPETIAGSYDPALHELVNMTVSDVYEALAEFRELARSVNPSMRFLLTVSPQRITATATGQHVLAADVYTKSVLRAAAGQMLAEFPDVDYLPGLEIASTPFVRGDLYAANRRNVTEAGAELAMRCFFAQHAPETDRRATSEAAAAPLPPETALDADDEDECEDTLLAAFAGADEQDEAQRAPSPA